jgi:hypothetical protein
MAYAPDGCRLMSHLIVRDTEGHLILDQAMQPEERYLYYRMVAAGDLVSFYGRRYTLHRVAWTKPESNLQLLVSFHSFDPIMSAASE